MASTWVELDLGILADNVQRVRRSMGPETQIIHVVKADGYGHGMIPVARCAAANSVRWFAVMGVEEGLALREVLPDAGVLLLGGTEPSEVPAMLDARLTPLLMGERHAERLSDAAVRAGRRLVCHIHLDTGMGRLGVLWQDAVQVVPRVAALPGLDVQGVSTHFASAEHVDAAPTELQAARFRKILAACEACGVKFAMRHVANSAGFLRDEAWDLEGVRIGLLLYGYAPGSCRCSARVETCTRPILQWKSRVVQVRKLGAGSPVSYGGTYVTSRPTYVATVSAGYSDGYPLHLSNHSFVLVGGRRRPVVGRVTMNLVGVDLGSETEVQEGDEAVLLGVQGQASIGADHLAAWAGTIPYEILTGIRATDRRVINPPWQVRSQ